MKSQQPNDPINRHYQNSNRRTIVSNSNYYEYNPIYFWGGCGGTGYYYPDFSFDCGGESLCDHATQIGNDGYSWGFNGCGANIQLHDLAGTFNDKEILNCPTAECPK